MAKVLLIDDDQSIRDTIGVLLRANGYEVLTANEGLAGAKLARSLRPDLVITDVVMKPVDGFTTLSILRQHSSTRRIPVVMITGLAEEISAARKGMALGADDYLVKPFEPAELIGVIRSLVERRQIALRAAVDLVERLTRMLRREGGEGLEREFQQLGQINGRLAELAGPGQAGRVRSLQQRSAAMLLRLRADTHNALVLTQLEALAGNEDAVEALRGGGRCELAAVAEGVARRVAGEAQRPADLNLAFQPGEVAANAEVVAKLVEELVRHAFEASPPESVVGLQGGPSAKGMHLRVTHSGSPQPPADTSPETAEFVRTEPPVEDKPGIALARRMVELHGGKLVISTKPDGTGVMLVDLPH